jgi:hypothetical protein
MKATQILQSTASTYLTYKLGKSLYIPLTSRCNSKTLPQLRGDGFMLPAHVVSSLCRVRDLEMNTAQWTGWCNYLDTQDGGKFQLPPRPADLEDSEQQSISSSSSPQQQQQNAQPSIEDLYREVQDQYLCHRGDRLVESIVFSGEGEPTCRWNDLLELASRIRDDDDVQQQQQQQQRNQEDESSLPIRLTTNGLVDSPWIDSSSSSSTSSLPRQLYDAGINEVSVMLMTHDRDLYDELVHPRIVLCDDDFRRAHDIVCQFITDCVQVDGLDVELTCVDQPDVGIDKAKTEALAVSLGVTQPIRWRPYFP